MLEIIKYLSKYMGEKKWGEDVKKFSGRVAHIVKAIADLIEDLGDLDKSLYKYINDPQYREKYDEYLSDWVFYIEDIRCAAILLDDMFRELYELKYISEQAVNEISRFTSPIYVIIEKLEKVATPDKPPSPDTIRILRDQVHRYLTVSLKTLVYNISKILLAVHYDPPIVDNKENISWEDVFKAGVIALGIIVVGNMFLGR